MWKDIPDYEGLYQINELGEVKSCERYIDVFKNDGTVKQRLIKERIMSPRVSYGQHCMGLSKCGKVEQQNLYTWLQRAFEPEKVFLKYEDNNPDNCTLSNCVFIAPLEHQPITLDHKRLQEDDLTQDILKVCFDYRDGSLIWKDRPINHFKRLEDWRRYRSENVGNIAGYYNVRSDSKRKDFGYWRTGITLGNSFGHFKLHRLIFKWHHGYLPDVVDHEDGDQNNNLIENLRAGDVQKNSCNLRIPVNNTSGYKGVVYIKGSKDLCWMSNIKCKEISYYLGTYRTKEEAAYAYNLAAKVLHKDFARLNVIPVEVDFKLGGKFFLETYPKLLDECRKG